MLIDGWIERTADFDQADAISAYNSSMNYFVRTASGAEHGPLSASQLREAARAGSLRRGDLVRPEGSVDWFRADRVRGLEFGASAPEVVRPSIAAAVSPSESALEVRSPESEPVTRSDPVSTADGLIRHIEPLALRGFNVRKLDGEEVESVQTQTFIDALRVSMPAALIGRRGILVLTNRRVFVANATVFSRSLQSAYLDRIDRLGYGSRTALPRFLLGAVLALLGGGIILSQSMSALSALGGFSAIAHTQGVIFLLVGALLILLARFRALEIGVASGTLVFAKRSIELDALSRIDEIRAAAITSRSA